MTADAKRVSFHTLGCRLNQAETALIAEGFRRDGYAVVEHGDPVDVAVIHTCSVTEKADARCRNAIRKVRRRSPGALVCAVGCYAQAEPERVAAMDDVDVVVGTDRKYGLAGIVREVLVAPCEEGGSREPLVDVSPRPDNGAFEHAGAGFYPHTTRANVKIQDGCDFCCAFCILPRVRGRARSRRFGEIVAEARELARRGHRELVVTGVNVGTWSFEDFDVSDVARALSEIEGVARVRISSIEPTTVPESLLDWMATDPKACRHLHLPLQSGDDEVLGSMRRVYTSADYRDFAREAVRRVPGLALGTDVIVGYPGETDEAFEATRALVEEVPFAYLHVFPYSDRPRTKAAGIESKVPPPVIRERARILREIGERRRSGTLAALVGQDVDVLFETVDDDGFRKGFDGRYLRVAVRPDEAGENELASVRVESVDASGAFALGRVVSREAFEVANPTHRAGVS